MLHIQTTKHYHIKKRKRQKKKINKNINTSMRTINRNTFIFLHVLSDKHL